MRRLIAALVAALVFPAAAFAKPQVAQLVEGAIKALKTKSYEARLSFLPDFRADAPQIVRIVHVAPDLYHVEPLTGGLRTTKYFIENAAELVQVNSFDNTVQPLPERQYSVTDALTAKFLRDLGTHPGTVLLDGQYMGVPIYVLRQDMTKEKPYLITVGLRQDNGFPMFLQVVDSLGAVRMHNQYESIRFKRPAEIPDDLFEVPEGKHGAQRQQPHPSAAQSNVAPPIRERDKDGPRADRGRAAAPRAEKSAGSLAAELPLYPEWLPHGYALDGISVLDYNGAPGLVYQFEIFGPQLDDMLSVFQMRCNELGKCDLSQMLAPREGGYVLKKRDGWVVAVFGGIAQADLQHIVDSLASGHSDTVMKLLQETRQRDAMLEEATEPR